ncbi:MAG: hypothetical protein WEF53_00960 [Bacteroidota bacterium]
MQEHDLFTLFTERLANAGIRYVVTGSVASIVYGEPRVTLDIDLVIELAVEHGGGFEKQFPEKEFYRPPWEIVVNEIHRGEHGHFALVHHETGFKADIYLAGGDRLQLWALDHARRIDFRGRVLQVAPPEYVIVKKLEYFEEGGSEKHLRDIEAMLEHSRAFIDFSRIEEFLADTSALQTWKKLRQT